MQVQGGAPLLSPTAATIASLTVRARALRALEEHRAGMRTSAVLLERSRALCAAAAAAAAPEVEAPAAPARPVLRVVRGGASATIARGGASATIAVHCGHLGCRRPAAFRPVLVVSFTTRRLAVRGLPVRVCAAHADALGTLAGTLSFLEELRARMRLRGGEEPSSVRVEFEPIH